MKHRPTSYIDPNHVDSIFIFKVNESSMRAVNLCYTRFDKQTDLKIVWTALFYVSNLPSKVDFLTPKTHIFSQFLPASPLPEKNPVSDLICEVNLK